MRSELLTKKLKMLRLSLTEPEAPESRSCRMLMNMGSENIILVDKIGAICENMNGLNSEQEKMSKITNRDRKDRQLG